MRRLPIPGTLDHAFLQVGGRDTAIAMTRLASHKDEQLEEFLTLYDDIPSTNRHDPGMLEKLCLAVGLHPAEYFGKVCAIAYRYNFDVATFTAAAASPLVIQKAAEFAMEKDGFRDRELILKASKILELSPLVQVQQNQSTVNVSSNLPQIGSTANRVQNALADNLPPLQIEGEILDAEPIPQEASTSPIVVMEATPVVQPNYDPDPDPKSRQGSR